MPTLAVDNFNIVCATLGGFITLFGLVSYLLKEKFYLGEALISTYFGVIFSPHATNFIKPLQYANNDPIALETITLYFSRLVLGVQLVIAGVQLPSKYLRTEWKSLGWLLGPGMCAMWICTSLIVWALVPNISILWALAIGSCVTPTDPVLSNSIVKGKFADKNIPSSLQKIIIAESGANDGLGYPFQFLALFLIKYTQLDVHGGAGTAIGLWFGETWGYEILFSCVYGAVVGWIFKELLHWAEERGYVDRESFLVFVIALALFIVGTVGMIGSDDVLASFIAGSVFNWDDWFRRETEDDSLQPTIDMLLNVAIFMWYGAVCPWHKFLANDVIPIYRLIPLGIMVLLFRRLPMVLLFHKFKLIHQIDDVRRALFAGFFGPIGVSAMYYLYVAREFLRDTDVSGHEREEADRLSECIEVIVWFLIICSITVHGVSISFGKLGFYLPRTISTAISTERISASQNASRSQSQSRSEPEPTQDVNTTRILPSFRGRATTSEKGPEIGSPQSISWIPKSFARFGRHVFSDIKRAEGYQSFVKRRDEAKMSSSDSSGGDLGAVHPQISGPTNPRLIGNTITSDGSAENTRDGGDVDDRKIEEGDAVVSGSRAYDESGLDRLTVPGEKPARSITFADEPSRSRMSTSPVSERRRVSSS